MPFRVLAVVALLASLMPAPGSNAHAQSKPATDAAKSLGQLIDECMRDVERGHTMGRKLTPQQRMTAETQCRARAEAEIADRKNG